MMIRCPGCGGRNPRDALLCEWCRRPFIQVRKRGLSARLLGALSICVIVVLLLLVGGLAFLNASRASSRGASVVPTASPPPLPPLLVASPSTASSTATPTAPRLESTVAATATPVPTPSPTPRVAPIGNTGGLGANLRREPAATSPPVAAAAENATVRLLGPEQRGPDGRIWRLVEDSRGAQGWVPADFLLESPPATR